MANNINNINNLKEQINNNITFVKRRKVLPGVRKSIDSSDLCGKEESQNATAEESDDNEDLNHEESDDNEDLNYEESDNMEDSFDSIDNHPKSLNYYNYFVGGGQEI